MTVTSESQISECVSVCVHSDSSWLYLEMGINDQPHLQGPIREDSPEFINPQDSATSRKKISLMTYNRFPLEFQFLW